MAVVMADQKIILTIARSWMPKNFQLPLLNKPDCSANPGVCSQKSPVAKSPHIEESPCVGNAPTGSSIHSLSSITVPPVATAAPMNPINKASHGRQTAQIAG